MLLSIADYTKLGNTFSYSDFLYQFVQVSVLQKTQR